MVVEVQEVKKRKAKPVLEGLRFGTAFTDHMLMMEWTEVGGWQAPRIVPQGPLAIHPGATVLQYAQVCETRHSKQCGFCIFHNETFELCES